MKTKNKMVQKAEQLFLPNPGIDQEIARINIARAQFMLAVVLPLHLILITAFALALRAGSPEAGTAVHQWRIGIIYGHCTMLLISIVFLLAVWSIKRKKTENSAVGRALPAAVAFCYLFFGATLCVIDQLVTSSINPYLITSIAVPLVIMIHPHYSLLFYPLTYLAFNLMLPITQGNPDLLLTVRVNGFSSMAIGLGLALLMWRTGVLTLLQRKKIETQTRELAEKNEQLKKLAGTDMLTGLYNRMRFTEFVEQELTRIARTGEESALVLLDLDNFKEVNDSYGHPGGDVILQLVAGVIRGQLRETDILARFGGDEFSILLPGTSREGALKAAEKLRQTLENITFTGKLERLKITASFGITQLQGGRESAFETLYNIADEALYRAKENGRNLIECA